LSVTTIEKIKKDGKVKLLEENKIKFNISDIKNIDKFSLESIQKIVDFKKL
jgi:hypothetical protein